MDILSRLRALPSDRFHYKSLILVGIGWLFDAMNTGIMSSILPELDKEWGLQSAWLGRITNIIFIGMALGAVSSDWLIDRFGRKTIFAATMAVYNTATGPCAFAPDIATLLTCRFFIGIGLGGRLPVAMSLISRYAPPKVRGCFIVLLEGFWGLGWLTITLVPYFFIPKLDWHNTFLIDTLPILYILLVLRFISESVPYLLS